MVCSCRSRSHATKDPGNDRQIHAACARARATAGRKAEPPEDKGYGLGLDEQGRTVKIEHPGGSAEFLALQGFVWQALKELAGDELKKPTRNGFAVDGILESAK